MPVKSALRDEAPERPHEPPLAGTVVILLGGANCYAGRLLAGLGASVVLVEPPTGCPERRTGPFTPGPLSGRSSAWFRFSAAGLRSVVIDAAKRDGQATLRHALEAADLCLDSLAWERLDSWSEGCAATLASIDTIPVCSVGPTGELANLGADDLLIQASSGLMFVSGFPEGEPTPAVCELGRTQASLLAAVAVLSALHPDSNLLRVRVGAQSALSLTTVQTSNPGFLTWNGIVPSRGGLAGTGGPPVRCADGWAVFTPPPERWSSFVGWLREAGLDTSGIPDSLEDLQSMREVLPLILQRAGELAARHTKQAFYHEAQHRGLLCMPVNNIADLLADEHLAARGFFIKEPDGAAELVAPFHSQPPLWELHPEAPHLGEYTEEFLAEVLGFGREDIEALLGIGAISCCH